MKQPVSPKKLPPSSTANNNTASRPPGITILQHAAILAKSTEKKEPPVAKGLDSRHCPAPGKRQARAGFFFAPRCLGKSRAVRPSVSIKPKKLPERTMGH